MNPPIAHFKDYAKRLSRTLETFDWRPVERLAEDFLESFCRVAIGRFVLRLARLGHLVHSPPRSYP